MEIKVVAGMKGGISGEVWLPVQKSRGLWEEARQPASQVCSWEPRETHILHELGEIQVHLKMCT